MGVQHATVNLVNLADPATNDIYRACVCLLEPKSTFVAAINSRGKRQIYRSFGFFLSDTPGNVTKVSYEERNGVSWCEGRQRLVRRKKKTAAGIRTHDVDVRAYTYVK